MNSISRLVAIIILISKIGAQCRAAESPVVLDHGHNPIEVDYDSESWIFSINGSESGGELYPPEEATYHLTEATRLTIPDNPNFAFLGAPGDPVWIAPHIERTGVLLLGVSGESIAPGIFQNDRLNLRLLEVEGPGTFAVYGIDSSGGVDLFQDSSDGIGTQDTIPFGIGGHDHQNWAFSAPGIYHIIFQASGVLANGNAVESPEFTFRFAVGDVDPLPIGEPVPIDEGDVDVAVVFDGEQLGLEVFWGAQELTFSAAEAYYLVKANSKISVPASPTFRFLGAANEPAWVAPQAEVTGKLFLALAGDNLPSGVFVDDQVRVTLKAVQGPGEFSAYETDAFGSPTIYFNTADQITADDYRDVVAGEHYHMNWGFTEPGTYNVSFEARATLQSTGEEFVSELTEFQYRVVQADPSGVPLTVTRTENNNLSLNWSGLESATYQLQSRGALDSGGWLNVGNAIDGVAGAQSTEVSIEGSIGSQFYRLIELREN